MKAMSIKDFNLLLRWYFVFCLGSIIFWSALCACVWVQQISVVPNFILPRLMLLLFDTCFIVGS